jgi:hypothetical protein
MLVSSVLAPACAAAQPAQSASPAPQVEAPRQAEASLGDSMAKAVTMKIATFVPDIEAGVDGHESRNSMLVERLRGDDRIDRRRHRTRHAVDGATQRVLVL